MINSKKTSEIISYILSPVGIAFLVTILLSIFAPVDTVNYNPFLSIILGIFFLCIFPVFSIIYSYKKGSIDIWLSERKTRTPFYMIAIIGYVIGSIVFFYLNYQIMFVLSMAYLAVTLVVMISNFVTKVSSHTAGVAGPITALTFVFGINALPLFILVPIVTWARIKLKAHNYLQLITGIIISILVTSSIYILTYL